MKLWLFYILLFVIYERIRSDDEKVIETSEPFIWSKFEDGYWVCGSEVGGAILCSDNSEFIHISRCYCLYYDEERNMSQFGTCMVTCFHPQFSSYFKLRKDSVANAEQFNERMCIESSNSFNYTTNRAGRFCGRCQEGYGLTVYSYQFTICIPCDNYSLINWFKYLAMALGPLTFFYILVIFLKINFTSGYLNGVITSSQIMMSPLNLHIVQAWLYSNSISGSSGLNLLSSFFGILNLDFFRDTYSPFCLGPNFTALQVIALDYIPAVYPFVLIFLTYVCIKLYDRNFFLLVWAWKPFKYILSKYYQHLDVRTSLVETFASFILLSSVKIASVSLMLLVTAKTYNVHGKKLPTRYLYSDSTIEYFGDEHLPYGLLALFTGTVFVILPIILLLLYPCPCFQKLLNCFNLNFQILRIFMDAFQGCYKTEPYELRYFSAHYLILRVFILLITATVQSTFVFSATTIILILNCAFVFSLQPYRNNVHNKIDILAMIMLTFSYTATLMMMSTFYLDQYWLNPANAAFEIAQLLISLYLLGVFGWVLLGNKIKSLYYRIKKYWKTQKETSIEVFQREEIVDSMSETSNLVNSRRHSDMYT